ncbi:hypothetical protein PIB30_024020 [Stylosanthes scabra]|uniref:MLO-like protein n=1 Tax=Stylosanthes scabra TaxID=79078 RepID=A0ABU6Q9V7_9FABA|nr:hypothetical protein [Stylosanthes scabra]
MARTKRKSLLSALEKIQQELMLFGLLSLLMGHWIIFVAKICVKTSALSSRFFPCAVKDTSGKVVQHNIFGYSSHHNNSVFKEKLHIGLHNYCPEGHESLASYESLEQLHRFVFVLAITHVSYSFVAVALAMIKIYSWRAWENEAKTMALQQSLQGTPQNTTSMRLNRVTTFVSHRTSHPWSDHKVLVWLLCFSRQFWSSINRADYMALRLGFITTHELPLTYDFHNYMLRSMDDEFRDIVGVSLVLWIYAICCIFLNFHGSNFYFWLSFVPSILILIIGTKLHRVVVKLAIEIVDHWPNVKPQQFNLRDELFWFGKPRFLLRLIHLISFLNAFEMASFLWSLWEIKEPSCFINNKTFVVIRLSFGVVSQVWCSFITFPLYVIITQMGSRFKKSVVSENVRKSLSKWQRRVKDKQSSPQALVSATSPLSDSVKNNAMDKLMSGEGSSSGTKNDYYSHSDMDDDDDSYSPPLP